jgi:hypothetical protein
MGIYEKMENYFNELNKINVNEKTEKKNGLTYLSWAWAWGEVKKIFPDANYTIYENAQGWNYHTDGRTCWVKTGVTINDIEHIEELPVLNFQNKSIPLENVTSFDVNKAIQRSLTKACARHGLGLYIYAGEDLPESETGLSKTKEDEADDDVFRPLNEEELKSVRDSAENKWGKITHIKIKPILKKYGYEMTEEILKIHYEDVLKAIENAD